MSASEYFDAIRVDGEVVSVFIGDVDEIRMPSVWSRLKCSCCSLYCGHVLAFVVLTRTFQNLTRVNNVFKVVLPAMSPLTTTVEVLLPEDVFDAALAILYAYAVPPETLWGVPTRDKIKELLTTITKAWRLISLLVSKGS